MFNTIEEAIEFVQNRPRGEIKFDVFKGICQKLGNPQNGFKYIHVTGTNGKGSTITFLRDLLISHGFKVGTLQSPHLITHLDRIRVNGENIEEQFFLNSINKNYEFYIENNIGMFEIDYLIALDYFKKQGVDFVLIEVGIGGRLDSTNVVDNTTLSIITSISLDHTELLGDTIEKICIEKSEIIKNNSDVVTPRLKESLINIVRSKADSTNSKYHIVEDAEVKDNGSFIYKGNEYKLNTDAKYQISNACLALESLDILSKKYHFIIDNNKVKEALTNFIWRGRYDVVSNNPKIILDGAHNIEGITKLMESFNSEKGKKLIVFSALKRKSFKEMNELLRNHSDKYVVTTFNYPGAVDSSDFIDIEFIENYVDYISKNKGNYDVILICGSLYFISDVYNQKEFFISK